MTCRTIVLKYGVLGFYYFNFYLFLKSGVPGFVLFSVSSIKENYINFPILWACFYIQVPHCSDGDFVVQTPRECWFY